jgi:hypothetical protein
MAITITKIGSGDTPPARTRKQKTFPKGILKVRDPAKAPPRRHTRKQVIQLTGSKRKTLKHRLSKMSDSKVRSLVNNSGLLKSKNTPPALMRSMLEGGVVSGFISLY